MTKETAVHFKHNAALSSAMNIYSPLADLGSTNLYVIVVDTGTSHLMPTAWF